jgi:hypothetical protein
MESLLGHVPAYFGDLGTTLAWDGPRRPWPKPTAPVPLGPPDAHAEVR